MAIILSGLVDLFAILIAVLLGVYFLFYFVNALWHLTEASRFLKKDVRFWSLWSSKYDYNPFHAVLFGRLVDEVGADHVNKFWKSFFKLLAISIIMALFLKCMPS